MGMPVNTIINGDCLVDLDRVPDGSIDLVITDPPYGAGLDFANDALPLPDLLVFTEKWARKIVPKIKPTGSFYCFINGEKLGYFQSIIDKYLVFRRIVVWQFEGFFNGFHKNYDNRSEFVLFYTRGDDYTFHEMKEPPTRSMVERWGPYADENGDVPFSALTPSMRVRQKKKNYDRNPTNVTRGAYQGTVIEEYVGNTIKIGGKWHVIYPMDSWQSNVIFMKRARFKDHPAQKPEPLIEKFISISSNEGDVVLDPFAGSGTICAVAKKLRRKYVGIEIDPGFHTTAMSRAGSIHVTRRIDDFLKQP
jgi:site-specific DNA-methyltransferase (adenine-specific)